jgi:hypothetical protein
LLRLQILPDVIAYSRIPKTPSLFKKYLKLGILGGLT